MCNWRTCISAIALVQTALSAAVTPAVADEGSGAAAPWSEQAQIALDSTKPLAFSRDGRLPLFTNPTSNPGVLGQKDAEKLVAELDARGIAVITPWWPGGVEESLAQALPIARAQQKVGLSVNVNATSCMYSFFDGDERTAHVDAEGQPFFDESLWRKEMGCPYPLDFRKPVIRTRIEQFADAYAAAGVDIGFVWSDWEIDGPLEINRAHDFARRCVRCRAHVPEIDDFRSFQKAMREMRSYLQFYAYTEPLLTRFPKALVGNYALYPHDGYRYWLDFFESEEYVETQPFMADQGAKYREWYDDFPGTGYTYAMPVIYTWYWIYNWYDWDSPDYRWFYNMLLVASNAGKSTPAQVPIVPFVRRGTTAAPKEPDPGVQQMSTWSYQELMWHMLLRGTDTFFVWCGGEESAEEVRLVHEVYAAAQEYGEFLDAGMPINFDVPKHPGTVISGLVLRDRVLVRRTDFSEEPGAVEIYIGTRKVEIDPAPGQCQILELASEGP